jgi:hypothetical protein
VRGSLGKDSGVSTATPNEALDPAAPRIALLTLAALIGATGSSASAARPMAEFRVYNPVADTYVTASRPRANFGRARALRVDGSPETTAFIRFRLKRSRVPAASVTLLLRPGSPGGARYAVRSVEDNAWRERRLTFATAPDPSQRFASSKPVRRGAWSAVDVTAFVAESGGGEVSLAITTRGRQAISFGSRESNSGPRLVVRTDDGELDDLVIEALLRN